MILRTAITAATFVWNVLLSKYSELHYPPELDGKSLAKDTMSPDPGDTRNQTGSGLKTLSLLASFHRTRSCCVQNWGWRSGGHLGKWWTVAQLWTKWSTVSTSTVRCAHWAIVTGFGRSQTLSDQTEDALHKTIYTWSRVGPSTISCVSHKLEEELLPALC